MDLPEDSIRQYIDAKSAFTALEQATINIGAMLGDRYRGKIGALACVTGLMLCPRSLLYF